MPFPQPEEIITEVEEEAEGSTLATNKANQANNNNNNIQANKPKGGLNEEAEEEDSHQEEVREEPMGLKPLTHRTPDQSAYSAA